jgi:hypothetical protein
MLRRALIVVGCLLIFASPAAAGTMEGSCSISFFGDSTLHAIEGTGVCEPFNLNETESNGEVTFSHPQIAVKVASLKTGNFLRDRSMRKMFDSEAYPLIVGRFSDLHPDSVLKDWIASPKDDLPFTLQIGKVNRPVDARVSNLKVTPKRVSFTMEFTLSLKSFHLSPPSFLGIIRVSDPVRVKIRVALVNSAAAASKTAQVQ